MSYPHGYVQGVGPAAPNGSRCQCGRDAIAQCQGCGGTFCRACWWKHSHTSIPLPSPASPEPAETQDTPTPKEEG